KARGRSALPLRLSHTFGTHMIEGLSISEISWILSRVDLTIQFGSFASNRYGLRCKAALTVSTKMRIPDNLHHKRFDDMPRCGVGGQPTPQANSEAKSTSGQNVHLPLTGPSGHQKRERTGICQASPLARIMKYDSMQLSWPNFLIVGAANSGTTSLYTYLNQHPEVFLPALKEPHYFSQIHPAYEQRYLRTYVRDERTYLGLFRKSTGYRAVGEASTSYLSEPEAPSRIYSVAPKTKIIIILRDPVERAHSHYLMDVR